MRIWASNTNLFKIEITKLRNGQTLVRLLSPTLDLIDEAAFASPIDALGWVNDIIPDLKVPRAESL